MEMYEWIYQIVIEGIKYVLIAHWFLGFEFNRRKTKYLLLLYPLLVPVVEYLDVPHTVFLYCYSWGIWILFALFEGRGVEKVKAFFIIWFLIALVDALMLMVFVMLPNIFFINENGSRAIILGCVSVVFWGIMVLKCKKIQQCTKDFWKRLSNLEYVLLLIVFIPVSIIVGGMQSNLDNTTTVSMKAVTFMSVILAVCIFIIVLILFLYTKQSKKQLEKMNRLNIQYLELQKRYYEDSLKQYEDMRSFRHDINHHLYILSELCREDKVGELKEYIETMAKGYEKMRGMHSGNFIADCIISRILHELKDKEAFLFDLEGHFPETFFMEDIDFCILLSNLLENAKEAMERITGECLLQMEIKSFHQWFYLIVRNSVATEEIDFHRTSKADKRNHGFGVQNISRIVEKYHGTVEWDFENGMAEVKIKFDLGKLE